MHISTQELNFQVHFW